MDLKETREQMLLKWKHHGAVLCGICGILAPLAAFSGIILAILSYPQFSWQNSALSDMGAASGITRTFFNNGLIIGGLLAAIFGCGFFLFLKKSRAGKIGAAAFLLDALAVCAIGVFPSDSPLRLHFFFSVAFFVLFPVSGLALAAAFQGDGRHRLSLLTFALAAIAAGVWIAHWTVFPFGPNVAIPEMVAALCVGAWAAAVGLSMLKSADE